MGICEPELLAHIIRPTLALLQQPSPRAENLLLQAALASEFGYHLCTEPASGLGLYRITSSQHRDIWDTHLVHQPDLASTVRGLASQRAFLSGPDDELITNLRYATAIAWLIIARAEAINPQLSDDQLLRVAFNSPAHLAA
jgi:hypothetical protein